MDILGKHDIDLTMKALVTLHSELMNILSQVSVKYKHASSDISRQLFGGGLEAEEFREPHRSLGW
jgi:hypothetical protein